MNFEEHIAFSARPSAEKFFGITLRLGYQALIYICHWTHFINALLLPLSLPAFAS
jgi:hypothetical protein